MAVGRLCAGEYEAALSKPVASSEGRTFRQVAQEWTDGELHRKLPDKVDDIDHTNNVIQLRAYVLPVIGDLPIEKVGQPEANLVMERLPGGLARRTSP